MKIAVVGFGLIGGSALLGWQGLRAKGVEAFQALTTAAMDLNPATLTLAREQHLADVVTNDLATAVTDADLIVVAVPPGAMHSVFSQLNSLARPNAIISDVASVRAKVVAVAQQVLRADLKRHYVPLHPIAGSEKSGLAAARPDLFVGAAAVLTPLPDTDPASIECVASLWKALGARVLTMSPAEHDQVYALVSHAPHLLAYAMMQTLQASGVAGEARRAAGGGFRDFTRIAQADPALWVDIFLANRKALLEVIDDFTETLNVLRQALETEDVSHMTALLTEARDARREMNAFLPPAPKDAVVSTDLTQPTLAQHYRKPH